MIVFSNQILLAYNLYDLRCIILTIRKQIIAFKKGTFAPPPPQLKGRRGPCSLLPPLSGVPVGHSENLLLCLDTCGPQGTFVVVSLVSVLCRESCVTVSCKQNLFSNLTKKCLSNSELNCRVRIIFRLHFNIFIFIFIFMHHYLYTEIPQAKSLFHRGPC